MTDNILKKWSPRSRFAFGGASLSGEEGGYGFGVVAEREIASLVSMALDSGIRVFDSAPIYGFGASEKKLGKLLGKRIDVAIVSKSGVGWHDNRRVNMSNDPKLTLQMLEDSLRRLQRDCIEIYMIHWPDKNVDIRRPMEVLFRAKEQGKIGAIGLCNTNLEDFLKASEIAAIEVLQSQVNFFETPPADVLAEAKKRNIPLMGWGTFDKGIIAGTVTSERQFEKSDARSWAPWWKQSNKDDKISVMTKVLAMLKQHGFSGVEFGLKFALDHCEMPLIGAKSTQQLKATLDALHHLPDNDLMNELVELKEQLLPATGC